MQLDFWQQKWKSDQIGFHLPDVHPLLQKYHAQIFAPRERIFVPLCGKSKDLVYLAQQGFSVLGSELSEKAVDQFFQENYQSIEPDDRPVSNSELKRLEIPKVNIIQGDYFKLMDSDLIIETHKATGIYDRAALIALPKSMRFEYVEQLKRLMPTANMLLITLEYQQSAMQGPPFSVTADEVAELFYHANISQLWRKNIIDKEPRFRSKGLEFFYESAYHIHW